MVQARLCWAGRSASGRLWIFRYNTQRPLKTKIWTCFVRTSASWSLVEMNAVFCISGATFSRTKWKSTSTWFMLFSNQLSKKLKMGWPSGGCQVSGDILKTERSGACKLGLQDGIIHRWCPWEGLHTCDFSTPHNDQNEPNKVRVISGEFTGRWWISSFGEWRILSYWRSRS